MLYGKIDFTFWGVILFERALKCITLNKMKKSLVHCGDNALEFPAQITRFQLRIECTIRKVPYRRQGVQLPPSPPM